MNIFNKEQCLGFFSFFFCSPSCKWSIDFCIWVLWTGTLGNFSYLCNCRHSQPPSLSYLSNSVPGSEESWVIFTSDLFYSFPLHIKDVYCRQWTKSDSSQKTSLKDLVLLGSCRYYSVCLVLFNKWLIFLVVFTCETHSKINYRTIYFFPPWRRSRQKLIICSVQNLSVTGHYKVLT